MNNLICLIWYWLILIGPELFQISAVGYSLNDFTFFFFFYFPGLFLLDIFSYMLLE